MYKDKTKSLFFSQQVKISSISGYFMAEIEKNVKKSWGLSLQKKKKKYMYLNNQSLE